MYRLSPRFAARSLLGAVALAGCATVQWPASSRLETGAAQFARVLDSIRTAQSLEDDEVASAPRIRLVVPPTSFVNDRYVEASFRLSSDAYALVVAVDRDRRIRVLHPESPDQSGFAPAGTSNRLTRFFAGFGGVRPNGYGTYHARFDVSQRISPLGGGGVLLAVASDRPLQVERLIGADGDWDELELGRLVFEQSLSSAAHAIGRAVVLSGQDFNTDYTTFTGGRTFTAVRSFAASGFACDLASGFSRYGAYDDGLSYQPGYGAASLPRFIGFIQREGRTFARYAQGGECGSASYYDMPVPSSRPSLPDTTTRDSIAGRRIPRLPGAPRLPSIVDDGTVAGTPTMSVSPRTRGAGGERPIVASGLRFRPPELVPGDAAPPMGMRMSPRAASDAPSRAHPQGSETSTLRRERSAERIVERPAHSAPRQEPRAEAVRERPAGETPVRETPVREAPVREAPARDAPAREAVRRERAPVSPAPATP